MVLCDLTLGFWHAEVSEMNINAHINCNKAEIMLAHYHSIKYKITQCSCKSNLYVMQWENSTCATYYVVSYPRSYLTSRAQKSYVFLYALNFLNTHIYIYIFFF